MKTTAVLRRIAKLVGKPSPLKGKTLPWEFLLWHLTVNIHTLVDMQRLSASVPRQTRVL